MNRCALSFQTVYFHPSDRDEARRLGGDLYERLTRPAADPLAYGPSIPVLVGVAAENVDLQAADTVVIVPVLGSDSYQECFDAVLAKLRAWHRTLGAGHVLPVPTSANWRNREDELPGKNLLTIIYPKGDPRRKTLDEIVLETTRLWGHQRENVPLFISHSKADLAATDQAAEKIHTYVVTDTTGKAFFDATDLRPGESLGEQLDTAVMRGVLVAVRGDVYHSRVWCQRELLRAKLNGLPTLIVEVLRRGEPRSSPYGGNSPSLVWDGNPAPVVSLAMVEWLRSEFFRREARRIIAAANLPLDVSITPRPPELLDLAQGPLQGERAVLVLHPDPELSVLERRVLKAARPRLRLATPTTAFRRLLSRRGETADVASPLEGVQIAMSLSTTPDADGPAGFTRHHVVDATVSIARALISSGAAIAYGGDFRPEGYTPLLILLIQAYNQSASKRAQDLHSYLAATISPEASRDFPIQKHHLKTSPDMAAEALLPDPALPGAPPAAMYTSDMRRVMEKHTAARVILGGKTVPCSDSNPDGYHGRFPGVAEEAWRTLEARKPLYVVGGFGGAAGLVAGLLEGGEVPTPFRDATWTGAAAFAQTVREFDAHPARARLGLPGGMEDLARAVAALAAPLLRDDASATAWNGLTVAENRLLFRTRDTVILAALITKGLLWVTRRQNQGKLEIELIHDSLTAADNLDAIAIATLQGVPLGGAGAAIDHRTGGSATDARARGQTLVSLRESLIDADWLLLTSLGAAGSPEAIREGVRQAAAETVEQAVRHGFQRVGIVAFGGNVLPDTAEVAQTMLDGFLQAQAGHTVIAWYETDAERFEILRTVLEKNAGVRLTTRRAMTRVAAGIGGGSESGEPLILSVRMENAGWSATCLPPSSVPAAISIQRGALPEGGLLRLADGDDPQARGENLARLFFGPAAASILSQCQETRLIVEHDAAAARIPFEIMMSAPDLRPALKGGVTRRFSSQERKSGRPPGKPPKRGRLAVLLIANPTGDVPGADDEADAVRDFLNGQAERVALEELRANAATVPRVSEALARADIVHYCGRVFSDGPGPGGSGLLLADGAAFTGDDLQAVDPRPRAAFVHAGGAQDPSAVTAALAELFLTGGLEACVGTNGEADPRAGMRFAETFYTQAALGMPVEAAVREGRRELFKADEPDWANYVLYGDGDFRLVVRD